jgi:3-oxoadipate enol-lactonase
MHITGTAKINGAQLSYDIAGEGFPLILLHAGIADRRLWDRQIEVFAQSYQVIRYDLRGFGESTFPDGDYAHYQDLRGLLDHLNISHAHVCGVSMGGSTALDFTLSNPTMAKSLTMVGSSASGYTPPRNPEEIAAMRAFENTWDALYEADKLEEANELEIRRWVDGPRPSAQVDQTVRSLVSDMNLNAMRKYNRNTTFKRLDPPAFERLAEVKLPTLLVVGSVDTSDTLSSIDYLAANLPGAKKIVMEGLTHVPNLEAPEEFNRILLDFLASVP